MELQKDTLEESKRQSQGHTGELREHVTSLIVALEEAREQQVNLQPFKEHVLAQRSKMHQLQVAIEEERCKILQVDNRLEEILETSSRSEEHTSELQFLQVEKRSLKDAQGSLQELQ